MGSKPLGYITTVLACVVGTYLATISAHHRQIRIEEKVDQLLQRPAGIELKVEDVVGGDLDEKFFEINGKRFYFEIDGKPVEQYFRNGGN